MGQYGSLEENLQQLKEHFAKTDERKPDIEEMESTHQVISLSVFCGRTRINDLTLVSWVL